MPKLLPGQIWVMIWDADKLKSKTDIMKEFLFGGLFYLFSSDPYILFLNTVYM